MPASGSSPFRTASLLVWFETSTRAERVNSIRATPLGHGSSRRLGMELYGVCCAVTGFLYKFVTCSVGGIREVSSEVVGIAFCFGAGLVTSGYAVFADSR